jgi:xylulokinase
MKYVIGVDLGTSAVKVLLLSNTGEVCREVSKAYPLIQEKAGYSEQDPEEWVEKTKEALKEIVSGFKGNPADIEGLSFSGQMHGLVLLDKQGDVLRNAILWNDTRTTKQCEQIYSVVGKDRLLEIAKNPALEGFTLPKLLWVKEHEPELYENASTFLLPKDYLRYRLTGKIHMDYSDAAGTLLLDISNKVWSKELCDALQIDISLCPPLVESHDFVGTLLPDIAEQTGLQEATKVFAGGADNACAAIGSGVIKNGSTLCSIGTSGVVLSYEEDGSLDYQGKVHFFNHGKAGAFYTMGVTLAAGYSLSWFKKTFAKDEDFESFLEGVETVPPGARGLLFTPYIVGERTPYSDAKIRGSFIGIDSSHDRKDFTRAVLEGIAFSLNETVEMFREQGKEINSIISVGGGAKNDTWLQIQADIFNTPVHKLSNEQGPGIGAAILAALGCGWYPSLEECVGAVIRVQKTYYPIKENVHNYCRLFKIYQLIYPNTKDVNKELFSFR